MRIAQGEEDEDGETSKKHPPRPSAAECLKHSFFKQANKVPIEEEADDWSNAFGVWRKISSKMFELEASIVSQVSAAGTRPRQTGRPPFARDPLHPFCLSHSPFNSSRAPMSGFRITAPSLSPTA